MPLDQHQSGCVYNRHTPAPRPSLAGCGGYLGLRWFVLCTHPSSETWADANVTDRGYTTFLPMLAVRCRNRRGVLTDSLKPLFSGYLFVLLDLAADPWIPITHLPGVRRFIADGASRPTPCHPGAVEALQAGEASRRTFTPPSASLRRHDACQAVSGPWRGFPGTVVAISGSRAVVSVMLFGRLQDVHMPVASLVPAGEIG
jgi:transcription antitermination factor NusG